MKNKEGLSKHQLQAVNDGKFEDIFHELAYLNPIYYHGYVTMKESMSNLNEIDVANEEVYHDDQLTF